jgi:hypothetical protein
MKTVEQTKRRAFTPPPVYWADEIDVLASADGLSVGGQKLFPASASSKDRDPVSVYAHAINGTRAGDQNKAAHLVFTSCTTNEALTAFVKKYGPVVADAESIVIRAPTHEARGARTVLSGTQRWEVLRREQGTFSAALELLGQLRSDKPEPQALFMTARDLVLGTSFWIDLYEKESAKRSNNPWQDRPSWSWSEKQQGQAQRLLTALRPDGARKSEERLIVEASALLCHVLDAFPVRLTQLDGIPLEMPSEDVSFGIFPVLYFLLRCDYLWDAKLARCAWKDCKRWFRVGSHDSQCCSEEHSLKHRQWVYYHEGKGKQKRQSRRKQLKRARAL